MKVIGDGGHARVVWDVLSRMSSRQCKDMKRSDTFFVAIGDNAARKREVEKIDGRFFWIIHSDASVSDDVVLGYGSVVMAGAVIQTGAKIGRHCIINTGATVDHDCVLGDFVHIAPGAHLCGNVHVGEGTLVGVGVGIAPNTTIPAWTLVRARGLEMEPL